MLPGLIEAHGHLITLGHGSYDTWFPWIEAHGGDAMLTRVMETAARQLLMAGVTTTVDLGAPLQASLTIRDRINKGEVVGTRALVSGPWISRGAGGAMQVGFGGVNITTPQEAAAQVDKLAAAGVDQIKAHVGPDLRRLQGDRRGGPPAPNPSARARVRRGRRSPRARRRRRRAAARRIGGHGAALLAGARFATSSTPDARSS